MKLLTTLVYLTAFGFAQNVSTLESIVAEVFGRVLEVDCSQSQATDTEPYRSFCFTSKAIDAVTAGERLEVFADRVGLVPDGSLGGWVAMSPARGSGAFVRTLDQTVIIMTLEDGIFTLEEAGPASISKEEGE